MVLFNFCVKLQRFLSNVYSLLVYLKLNATVLCSTIHIFMYFGYYTFLALLLIFKVKNWPKSRPICIKFAIQNRPQYEGNTSILLLLFYSIRLVFLHLNLNCIVFVDYFLNFVFSVFQLYFTKLLLFQNEKLYLICQMSFNCTQTWTRNYECYVIQFF